MQAILPFLLILVVLWFVMIRPQQKRQREAQKMQTELVPGTKVMLTSGIFGVVHETTDDYIVVEIAENVSIRVVRAAIGRVLPEDFGEPSEENADAETAESHGDEHDAASDVIAVEPIEPEDDR